jgi:hypothetical protein
MTIHPDLLAALEDIASSGPHPEHPTEELRENISAVLDHFLMRMLTEHGVDSLLGSGKLPRTARLLGAVEEPDDDE